MTRSKKFSNIIKYIKAENSGKGQIQQHYECDNANENWFNRYVSDMCDLEALTDEDQHIKLRIVPFEENIPNLTEHEWQLVSDALRWIRNHKLEATVTSTMPKNFDTIIDKISKRHLSHKGQSTELLTILEDMKNGIEYERQGWSEGIWEPISDKGYNLYHMINDAREGRIRKIDKELK